MNFREIITSLPLIITEGAVIERLKREFAIELDPHIANAGLIYNPAQRQQLKDIYKQYIDVACAAELPIMLFTPTWRASAERVAQAQLVSRNVNLDCVQFLSEIKSEYQQDTAEVFIGGLIGCKGDAYSPQEALNIEAAMEYHCCQIKQLANTGVDFLIAETLPAISEAIGIAKAMAVTGKPYIIGFVIRDNGTLLDGTPLCKAIGRIDTEVTQQPIGYVVNCVHPLTFRKAVMSPVNASLQREKIIGLMGNTSTKSPEELDEATTLQTEEPEVWAEHMIALYKNFGIKVLGGCCGTNNLHIEQLAKKICSLIES